MLAAALLWALAAEAGAQINPIEENKRRLEQADAGRKRAERDRLDAQRQQQQAEREKAGALERARRAEEELAKLIAAQAAMAARQAASSPQPSVGDRHTPGATAPASQQDERPRHDATASSPPLSGQQPSSPRDLAADPITPGFSAASCPPTVPLKKVRHGFGYRFWDEYSNNNEFLEHRLVGLPRVYYSEEADYNHSTAFPPFGWTESLRKMDFVVPPKTTVRYIEASESYPFSYRPKKRSGSNFAIAFSSQFYARAASSGDAWLGPFYSLSCARYEVTWCGDGVVDADEGEECDSGEQNADTGQCSTTCRKRH